MDDDLDTPGALAGIFELVTAAHSAADAGDEDEGARLAHTAAVLAAALGLSLRAADTDVDEESARLVAERDEARRCQGLRPGRRPAGRAGRPGLDRRGHPERHRHPALIRRKPQFNGHFPAVAGLLTGS